MEESPKEALTHTLALVVVAALLILVAATLGSLKFTPPSWMSQAAATPAATTVEDKLPSGQCTETTAGGYGYLIRNVHYACVQEGKANTELLTQSCSAGFEYEVTIQGGTVSVKAKSRAPRPPECTLTTAPPKCTTGTPLESVDDAPGTVSYIAIASAGGNEKSAKAAGVCGSGPLEEAVDPLTNKKLSNLATGDLLSQFDPKDVPEAVKQMGAANGSDFVNNSFDAALAHQEAIVKEAQKDYAAALQKYAGTAGGDPAIDAAQQNLENAQSRFDALKTRLGEAKVALTADPPSPTGGDDVPGGGDPGPTGPTGPTGFDQPGGPPGGGDAKKGGVLEQLLQGLMKALGGGGQGGGGQPPPGNQDPKTPGTCNPQLVCSDNTLYSRNTQCVDTPVQQCPHGCSGTACKPAPSSPNAPTAQLSCQPQVADAGMILTISWGCSTGTAVGSGFSTGAVRSGSATTTLSTPPTGANHISFGLVCTHEGQSASASCDVQVGKPAIVLVANPKSVTSGGTSQIGWVTSGMKECTVSSPDQADFTSSNAARTNANGVAESSPVTGETDFLLTCMTVGGNTRSASTTVSIL